MTIQNRTPFVILLVTTVILAIPFVAMLFTNEVNWNVADFVIAGALLAGTGFVIDFFLRKVKKTSHRIAIICGIVFAFAVVWAELAVGIFGSPLAGR